MTDIRGIASVTPTRLTSDGNFLSPNMTRDGGLITADWFLARAAEGRVFTASFGTQTTPLTAVAYNQDQPEITLSVPSGTTIIPIEVRVTLESFAGTDNEIIISYVTVAVGAGTSTAASIGPTSMRSDAPVTSNVTARQLHTADVTITGYTELDRFLQPLADTNPGAFLWKPAAPPVLIGASSLMVQVAGTTTQPTFYGQATWAEVPSTMFT